MSTLAMRRPTPIVGMSQFAAASRIDWIDSAKALAVVLVVSYHCSGWIFDFVFADATTPLAEAWRALSDALVPVRIPLFFLVSGVLAGRAVLRSWTALARTRLIDLMWPFLVWTVLIAPLWMIRLAAMPGGGSRADDAGLVLSSVLFGGAHYWFLPALALFLVVGKLTVRVPVSAMAGSALLAFVVAPLVQPWLSAHTERLLAANAGRWMELLFWFLLGCFGRALLVRVVDHPARSALAGTVAFAVLWSTGIIGAVTWLVPLLSFAGVIALVGWSALGARVRPLRRLSHYLATRTLAIYLGHQVLLELIVIVAGLVRRVVPGFELAPWPLLAVFTPGLTILLVWASTALHDRAVHGRAAWLYRPPARWKLPVVSAPM